ncbi:MAG: type II toxin-antitoxin system VapC family toxin [Pseudomonadota bacterium]
MILVDSSVWIDYFRGIDTAQTDRLDRGLADAAGRMAIGDLIVAEVLQGFRSDKQAREANDLFGLIRCLQVGGRDIAFRAARNYRQLRAKGVTVRSTIDCLIATYCIEKRITLLHADRDFDPFVQYLGLRCL